MHRCYYPAGPHTTLSLDRDCDVPLLLTGATIPRVVPRETLTSTCFVRVVEPAVLSKATKYWLVGSSSRPVELNQAQLTLPDAVLVSIVIVSAAIANNGRCTDTT